MASDILISGKHLERVPLNLKIRVRSVCSDLTELWLQEGELYSMQILSRDQKVGQTTLSPLTNFLLFLEHDMYLSLSSHAYL